MNFPGNYCLQHQKPFAITFGVQYQETQMVQKLRIKLARWILGKHCACYQMGHHNMVDFQQRSAEQLAKAQARNKTQ
jgi:hypothetical protein